MDPAVLSASAAVLGSLAGGAASLATVWLSQKTQAKRESVQVETRKREQLYADFLTECSKLALDALDHTIDRPETLQLVYTLVNRIRLTSSDAVLHAGEAAIQEILARYREPKIPIEKLRNMTLAEIHDPLKAFSEACRDELQLLRRNGA